jgi:nucleoid-associated protein YgaU
MALISRLQKRSIKINRSYTYDDFFRKRDVEYVKQYNTPTLEFPTKQEMGSLTVVTLAWKIGDRYEKLAAKHYGDPEMWWVIAAFNKKPAEFLITVGDVIHVPLPLEHVLDYMGY